MKIHKKELTPEEFVSWAIQERRRRSRIGKTRIDTKVAVLHRQGRVSNTLYQEYLAALNAAP